MRHVQGMMWPLNRAAIPSSMLVGSSMALSPGLAPHLFSTPKIPATVHLSPVEDSAGQRHSPGLSLLVPLSFAEKFSR